MRQQKQRSLPRVGLELLLAQHVQQRLSGIDRDRWQSSSECLDLRVGQTIKVEAEVRARQRQPQELEQHVGSQRGAAAHETHERHRKRLDWRRALRCRHQAIEDRCQRRRVALGAQHTEQQSLHSHVAMQFLRHSHERLENACLPALVREELADARQHEREVARRAQLAVDAAEEHRVGDAVDLVDQRSEEDRRHERAIELVSVDRRHRRRTRHRAIEPCRRGELARDQLRVARLGHDAEALGEGARGRLGHRDRAQRRNDGQHLEDGRRSHASRHGADRATEIGQHRVRQAILQQHQTLGEPTVQLDDAHVAHLGVRQQSLVRLAPMRDALRHRVATAARSHRRRERQRAEDRELQLQLELLVRDGRHLERQQALTRAEHLGRERPHHDRGCCCGCWLGLVRHQQLTHLVQDRSQTLGEREARSFELDLGLLASLGARDARRKVGALGVEPQQHQQVARGQHLDALDKVRHQQRQQHAVLKDRRPCIVRQLVLERCHARHELRHQVLVLRVRASGSRAHDVGHVAHEARVVLVVAAPERALAHRANATAVE